MKRLKLLLIIISIIIAIIFLNILGIADIFQKALFPIQNAIYSAGLNIKSFFQLQPPQELQNENQKLKEKFNQTVIDRTELELLKQENEFLKKELDFLENSVYDYQIVKIIGRETSLGEDTVIINKGSDSNIEIGFPVILSGERKNHGYLIGKITQVKKTISHVALITSPKSLIAAKVLTSTGTTGLIKGERGLTLKMDLIPADKEIKINDLIVASGLEDKIPEGLIIGEVEGITSNPGDFFNQAKIKPFIDFDNLKIVTVLLP